MKYPLSLSKSLVCLDNRRFEQFTVDDVAKFIIDIDPSFDGLACRFLREVCIRIVLNS